MAQGDPKNKDKYLMALARLKEGNWTPEALKALDTVEAQTAWQRAASLAGFSSVIANTPREQLAGALYSGYGQVAGDKGHYEVTATDPKTGYQTRKYIPGESSKFFENNAGANVLFAKNKEPGQIVQGVEDDKTRVELDKVYKSYDNGSSISAPETASLTIYAEEIRPTSRLPKTRITSKPKGSYPHFRERQSNPYRK
jgi:hypothetical protein